MAGNQKRFFKCFSINFHRFLKTNGLRYMSKGEQFSREKDKMLTFWVYEHNDTLEYCLKRWAETKDKGVKSTNEKND